MSDTPPAQPQADSLEAIIAAFDAVIAKYDRISISGQSVVGRLTAGQAALDFGVVRNRLATLPAPQAPEGWQPPDEIHDACGCDRCRWRIQP